MKTKCTQCKGEMMEIESEDDIREFVCVDCGTSIKPIPIENGNKYI